MPYLSKEDALKLIRGGRADTWNGYRESNPDWVPDLSGEHLGSEHIARFDLSGSDLRGADLSGAILIAGFNRIDLRDAKYDLETRFASGIVLEEFGAILYPEPPESAPENNGGISIEDDVRILFLSANPTTTSSLDLENEIRTLRRELKAVDYRDRIELIWAPAARPDDLIEILRSKRPNVLHFSGHGSKDGIFMRSASDDLVVVDAKPLRRALKDRGLKLVVLNSCFSESQGARLSDVATAVVGTTDAVRDVDAQQFSKAFYRTIGNGHSIQDAFRDAGDSIELEGGVDVFRSFGDLSLVLLKDNRGSACSN